MDARPAVAGLVAVALVVAAGCGSLPADAGGPGTDTPTLTPAPVPTTTAEPVTLPPGVTGAGVPNANALFAAHHRHLRDTSYTLYVRELVGDEESEHVFRVEGPDRYYQYDYIASNRQTIVKFADGDSVYVNSTLANLTSYVRGNATDAPTSHTVRLAKVFLRLDDARVAEILVDGDLHYEIRAEYDAHPRAESLENFSVRAVVSPDGFVRSMNATYTFRQRSSGTTNVTRYFEYRDVGSTMVEPPAWVRERWDVNASGPPASSPTGE